MSKCEKIGEGVYGEVFRSKSREQSVTLKIIPVEEDLIVNDCPQKKFEEIIPEMVIARGLSDLSEGEDNKSCNFCQVNRISIAQGIFPDAFLKQWDAYSKRKISENDRPDQFTDNQLLAVFQFGDAGTALEHFKFTNHNEDLSELQQVIFALAVAEVGLEFEHRDLHIENVLMQRCSEEKNLLLSLVRKQRLCQVVSLP